MLSEPNYRSVLRRHFSYVDRGRYAEQLECWMRHIDREQMLILPAEPFFSDPATRYARVLEHLGLPAFVPDASRLSSPRSSRTTSSPALASS